MFVKPSRSQFLVMFFGSLGKQLLPCPNKMEDKIWFSHFWRGIFREVLHFKYQRRSPSSQVVVTKGTKLKWFCNTGIKFIFFLNLIKIYQSHSLGYIFENSIEELCARIQYLQQEQILIKVIFFSITESLPLFEICLNLNT